MSTVSGLLTRPSPERLSAVHLRFSKGERDARQRVQVAGTLEGGRGVADELERVRKEQPDQRAEAV